LCASHRCVRLHDHSLVAKLAAGTGTSDIKQLLDAEITVHFGMSQGQVETASMAERLAVWWQTTGR